MHGVSLVATRRLACLCADLEDPVVDRLRSWADSRGLTVAAVPVGEPVETPDPTATLGVTVGGDGTFLEGVRAFAPRGVPIAGVNRGTLSFLARIPADEMEAALDEILEGQAQIRERQRFAVDGGSLDTGGINDVMVEPLRATDEVRTCRLEAFVDGEYLGTYAGRGVVVATPTGSTAMALSAGGPVHGLGGDTLQVSGLHPDQLGVRPVVFAADRVLTLVPRDSVHVTVDGGRAVTTVGAGGPLRITGAGEPAHVVRTSRERSFVAALTAKLGWAPHSRERTPPDPRALADTRGRDHAAFTTTADREGATDEFAAALRVAREAATAAGGLVARYADEHGRGYRAAATAQRRAREVLVTVIERTFPEDTVVTGDGLPEGRAWLLDPLDGVTNFEHANPSYCTSVALVVDGEPVVGVVYAPASGELFAASRGGDAYRNSARIEPTDRNALAESMLLSGYDPDGRFLRTCYRYARGVRRVGSQALDLCFVAAGSADACWEYDTRPRDVAAGLCILRAAGGHASSPSGEPFRLDGDGRTPLLVSNGPLHPVLLELLDREQPTDAV